MTIETQQILVRRLVDKIQKNVDKIIRIEEDQTDGADVVVVSYGITSRVAQLGVELAREQGAKVGTLRLVVCWPFPEARIRELARGIKAFVVPEINFGQMVTGGGALRGRPGRHDRDPARRRRGPRSRGDLPGHPGSGTMSTLIEPGASRGSGNTRSPPTSAWTGCRTSGARPAASARW